MSIFQHPLMLVFFSFLMCPVASQTGQTAKEVKSGNCASTELIGTAAHCQSAAIVLELVGTVQTINSGAGPPGCYWYHSTKSILVFNTHKASTTSCDPASDNLMCLCTDPCPIGTYQNEESSKTCKSCLAGTYNNETGKSVCESCLPGLFNDETGRPSCKSCPEGWDTTSPGSKTCIATHNNRECTLPTLPANSAGCGSPLAVGTSCTAACKTGYDSTGDGKYTCSSDGVLSPTNINLKCTKIPPKWDLFNKPVWDRYKTMEPIRINS